VSDPRDWAQRLLAETPAAELAPRPAPRRVLDGALDETLRRPVWCLCTAALRGRGLLDPLVELLRERGRRVVLLEDPAAAAGPAGMTGSTGSVGSVGAACRQLDVTPADVVQVETPDGPAPPADGARRLLLGVGAGRQRGLVAVSDVDALARLFRGGGGYVSGSTYHEI
jgi:hypothetical protein